MTREELSRNLWQVENLLTGFAVVQAVGFIYACATPEFAGMINTPLVKLVVAVHLAVVTVGICYSVWWCGKKGAELVEERDGTDGSSGRIRAIRKRVTGGRIVVILSLLLPTLLSLYAKQLGGRPYNRGPDNRIEANVLSGAAKTSPHP